jgi:hypothetical protein
MSLSARLRLTAKALEHKQVPIATLIVQLNAAADALDDPCVVDPLSSRICSRGTPSCRVDHKKEDAQR